MTRKAHCRGNRVGCARIWIKQAARLPLQAKASLPNLLLEFRRCINAGEQVIFFYEDARTPSAT